MVTKVEQRIADIAGDRAMTKKEALQYLYALIGFDVRSIEGMLSRELIFMVMKLRAMMEVAGHDPLEENVKCRSCGHSNRPTNGRRATLCGECRTLLI